MRTCPRGSISAPPPLLAAYKPLLRPATVALVPTPMIKPDEPVQPRPRQRPPHPVTTVSPWAVQGDYGYYPARHGAEWTSYAMVGLQLIMVILLLIIVCRRQA